MADQEPTFRSLVAAFTDFLTVAIHSILHERNIYPKTSFLSARKYNFPVRQNRHPKVCEWINDAVAALEVELFKGSVDRVAVVIYTEADLPRERFVFDLSRFPVVPISEADTPLQRSTESGEKESILPVVDMEEQFRATMSRISNCGNTLKPTPEGCTFTLAVELKSEGNAPVDHPQAWIPVQPILDNDTSQQIPSTQAVPLRTVAAGGMVFESWIEECE